MGVCGFEVGKVSQSDVGQEINQHIGNNRTLVCECYFCIHHARLSDSVLPRPPESFHEVYRGPYSGPYLNNSAGDVQ